MYVLLAVVVFLSGMLVAQTVRLNDTAAQLEKRKRTTRKKLAVCKTALKSYVNSFHAADKQQRVGDRTMARHSRALASLAQLAKRRDKAEAKLEEYDAALVDLVSEIKPGNAEGRKQQRKIAKTLKRRDRYRKKVDRLGDEMDHKIARLDENLNGDGDTKGTRSTPKKRLARKGSDSAPKKKNIATRRSSKK